MLNALTASNFYFNALILVAGICFIKEFFFKTGNKKAYNVPRWNIGWISFGLMIWGIACSFILGSSIQQGLYFLFPSLAQHDIQKALVIGYSIQGAQLAILIFILYRFKEEVGKVNSRTLSWIFILKKGFWHFLAGLPLIWLSSEIWALGVNWLHQKSYIDKPKIQAFVEIYLLNDSTAVSFLFGILSVILAPIVEEYIFRGLLYRFLKSYYSPIFAIIAGSLFFACMHSNLLTFFPLFVVGLLLTRTYEMTGNLNTCIVFHALFNLNTLILLSLNIEGI